MRRGQALLPNCAVAARGQLGLPVSMCSEELCAERLLPSSAVTDEPVSLIPVLQTMIRARTRPILKHMKQDVLRWLASLWTVGPGLVIAARVRPLFMGWAFVGLTVGSLTWIVAGYLADDHALIAQNVVITLINCLGIYRWLIWKGKA
jgi:hypothetical protein